MMEATEIPVGDLVWVPHHEWLSGVSTQIDGFLRGKGTSELDIWATGDYDLTTESWADADIEAAKTKWDLGEAHALKIEVNALLIPADTLTYDLIQTALTRFLQ